LTKHIEELDEQVGEQARQRPQARRLMTHPGVGPVTALVVRKSLISSVSLPQVVGHQPVKKFGYQGSNPAPATNFPL
jgi:hypothetical protein